MAEDELPLVEGQDQEVAPETAPEPAPAPEPPSVEDLARKGGWLPQDEFKGDPEKWRPADEYLLVGRDTVRSLGRELKNVRDQMGRMTSVSESIMADRLREQEARLKAERREAIEAGDADRVEEIDEARDQIRARVPSAIAPPPETEDFIQRNAWFNTDPVARNFAYQVCELNKNLPVSDQLRLAETEVRKRFPEHFPEARQTKPAPQVNNSTTRAMPKASKGKTFHDMPAEAQAAARDFQERHNIPLEDYASRYWNAQERQSA